MPPVAKEAGAAGGLEHEMSRWPRGSPAFSQWSSHERGGHRSPAVGQSRSQRPPALSRVAEELGGHLDQSVDPGFQQTLLEAKMDVL